MWTSSSIIKDGPAPSNCAAFSEIPQNENDCGNWISVMRFRRVFDVSQVRTCPVMLA
jgi:hypothetical protein